MVGALGTDSATADGFRSAEIRPQLGIGLTCANIVTSLKTADPSAGGYYAFVKPDESGLVAVPMNNGATAYCPGKPGSYEYLQIFYALPVFSPIWRLFVSYMAVAGDSTNDLDSLKSAASNLKNCMDVGDSTKPQGSGGTHFENVLPAINKKITRIGNGTSSAAPIPFVFLVTDGLQNDQYWDNGTGWTGSQPKQI